MFNRANLQASLVGIGAKPDIDVFDELASSYAEPGRYYHTDRHIAECLGHCSDLKHLANQPYAIEVAIWFHDAIYNTKRTDNERKSADWAASYLSSEGVEKHLVRHIFDMIVATKTHETTDTDSSIMLDIDLGILGSSVAVFEEYDQAIRMEYDWVPQEQYRIARIQVLQSFLSRDEIFKTVQFQNRYEAQARKNLQRKIIELGA